MLSSGHSPKNADATLPTPMLRTWSQRKFSREHTHFQVSPPHGSPRCVSYRHPQPCVTMRRVCSASEGFLLLGPLLQDSTVAAAMRSGPSSGDLGPGSSPAADSQCQQIPLFPHQEPLHSGPLIPCDRPSTFPQPSSPVTFQASTTIASHPGLST